MEFDIHQYEILPILTEDLAHIALRFMIMIA
jgi:hypothetical protein